GQIPKTKSGQTLPDFQPIAKKVGADIINDTIRYTGFVYMPGKAKVLTSQEIKRVLGALKKPRDKTLFLTGLYTGLRISELISIEQSQVFTAAGGVRNLLKLVRLKKKNTVYSNIP